MNDWTDCTWGDVVTLQRGFDITKNEQVQTGVVPVVSSGGISSFHNQSMSMGPGVIIGRKGTLGKVHYIDGPYWPHDTTLWVKDFKGNVPRFVYYALMLLNPSHMNVGSASPTLNRNDVHPLPVRWPSHLGVQQAIAEVLGALDDKIAANERFGLIVRELMRSEFDLLEIVSRGGTEGNAQVSEIVDLNPRTELTKKDEVCPFLEMKNLPVSDVTIRTWGERVPKGGSRFVNGDTLLARITPCLENGKTGLVDFLGDGEVGTGSTEYVVMRPRSGVPKALVYCLAVHGEFRAFAIRHMVGTSGRQRVAAADLTNFEITMPGGAGLKRFEQETDSLLAGLKATVDESRALTRTRDELLPLLMSGRVTVKDAEGCASDLL